MTFGMAQFSLSASLLWNELKAEVSLKKGKGGLCNAPPRPYRLAFRLPRNNHWAWLTPSQGELKRARSRRGSGRTRLHAERGRAKVRRELRPVEPSNVLQNAEQVSPAHSLPSCVRLQGA